MNLTIHPAFLATLARLPHARELDPYDLIVELAGHAETGRLPLAQVPHARDSRVRTARLDDEHDAVVFVVRAGEGVTTVLALTGLRAEAQTWARTAQLTVDTATGALEVVGGELPPHAAAVEGSGGQRGLDRGRARDAVIDLRHVDGQRLGANGSDPSGPSSTGRDPDDDEVTTALAHDASRAGFVVVTDDVDLRRVLDGDFAAWTVFLHPAQRALAYRRSYGGSFRVTGGPGTGKTVVALHRTFHLARTRPSARILLCTFNRTLADTTRHKLTELAGSLAERVDVLGIDQVVQRVVRDARRRAPHLLSDQDDLALWRLAAAEAGPLDALPAEGLPHLLRDEYRYVILPLGLETGQDEYLSCLRRGRGTPLGRRAREQVWRAVLAYRYLLGQSSTFAQQTAVAVQLAGAGAPALRYDHVVVDEGQDLQPLHWLLLRRLVPPGPDDLFVCEDADQRLYGPLVALSHYGINTRGRSRRLDINYRSTGQILATATRVLGDLPAADLEGDLGVDRGYSRLSGAQPQLLAFSSRQQENEAVSRQLHDWIRTDRPAAGELAVLVRRNRDAQELTTYLRRAGVPARAIGVDDPGGSEAVHILTMHRAKGAEYAKVVVARVTDGVIPDPRVLADAPLGEVADVMARERSLLYVAYTRARDELVVTYAGTPSRFLEPLLPGLRDGDGHG